MRAPALCLVAAVASVGCHPSAPEAGFSVRESVQQLQVTHATPGDTLEAVDGSGAVSATGTVDPLGSLMFRQLAPGSGYRVRVQNSSPLQQSRALTVKSIDSSKPDPASYATQKLVAGFNYLTMRDGTTLSAFVTLPGPETGRYPTVVNYSGYSASKPDGPLQGFEFLCNDVPVLCHPPDDGSALVAAMFGYATVSVNIRGTGCSGGAYDYFETMQVLDGYDVIETVAAQSWAANHKVGMVGLSYPGITQLFVAKSQPPGLAAIAPSSVIGNTASTLLPGGMLNDGFAIGWVDAVLSKAVPYGQGWEQARVDGGDTVCAENQLLHGQLVDNVAQARMTEFYVPALHDPLNPTTFVGDISVPVFLTGQWQDEQTGPYFFTLFDRFTSSPAVRFTTLNGVHIDGFAPALLSEWHAFLELFVARRVPVDPQKVANFAPFVFQTVFGTSLQLPVSPYAAYGSYDEALAAWKAAPKWRQIFESGAGDPMKLGAPIGTFEHAFAQWPPPGSRPLRLYLQPDGSLGDAAPAVASSASRFALDPAAGSVSVVAPSGNVWDELPAYDWKQPVAGSAVVAVGAALGEDTTLVGTASVDLWLRSPVDDADLEVTISEVRPDGQEMYVQSGWLRASHRKPGPAATELWPAQTFTEENHALLTPGQWVQVRIGTAGFAHVFRAGSRVRLSVDTPGGVRADWKFALKTFASAVAYDIGHDATHPSSVVLPRVDGIAVTSPLPPCPSLRGQPCRANVPYINQPSP